MTFSSIPLIDQYDQYDQLELVAVLLDIDP